MFTLILVLSILFSAWIGRGWWLTDEDFEEFDIKWIFLIVSIIFNLILALAIVIMASELCINSKTLDQKISMHQNENEKMENQLDLVVNKYQEYEKDTYERVKEDYSEIDIVALVSMYPELRSDTLIQKQIDVYVKNNESIKELKEKKIDLSRYKWFLYFGR